MLQAAMNLLVAEIYYCEERSFGDTQMEVAGEYIAQAIHSRLPLALSDLLSKTGLSRHIFASRFEQYFHTTFKKYIFHRRMEYAKNLLQETDLSIKEIASKAGYSDPYIFSNQFKTLFHLSPREYRKQLVSFIEIPEA